MSVTSGALDGLWFFTAACQSGWTTQAIGQQHTSPLRAGCEARRREIVVIFGCGNGLARDAPEATKVDLQVSLRVQYIM